MKLMLRGLEGLFWVSDNKFSVKEHMAQITERKNGMLALLNAIDGTLPEEKYLSMVHENYVVMLGPSEKESVSSIKGILTEDRLRDDFNILCTEMTAGLRDLRDIAKRRLENHIFLAETYSDLYRQSNNVFESLEEILGNYKK